MKTRGATPQVPPPISHLWQVPLLLASLALSACAACLFLEARPGITLNQQLAPARTLLAHERPDAAIEALTRLVKTHKLSREGEAQVHLLLAEAIEASQKQRRQSAAASHLQIIEQTQIALGQGVAPTGEILRRLGESYEAVGKPLEAVSQYRQAIAIDPPRALRLQRKVIDLQLAQSDWAPAEASIDAYLATEGLTDAERAWAKNEKAQLLIDRGEYVDARRLLEDALKLDGDSIAQAETKYRLGVCAWKLKDAAEAQKLTRAARVAFKGQHPLDAKAAYVLGCIAQDKSEHAEAIAMFDVAVVGGQWAGLIGRGLCRVQSGDEPAGIADLIAAGKFAKKDDVLAGMRKASAILSARSHYRAAIEVLLAEQSLDGHVAASFYDRLALAYEKRAEQVEQSTADAGGAERARRTQLANEFTVKAADAHLAFSRALAATGDKGFGDALFKALDQYDRGGARQRSAEAMELFVSERADDALAPQALLRLGKTYESMTEPEKAISAYQRLQVYTQSPAASEAAVPLATLLIAKGSQYFAAAEKVLRSVPDSAAAARAASLELARLQHRMGNFKEALPRLDQYASKYAGDENLAEVTYLRADCLANLAERINDRAASATASANGAEGPGALERAREQKQQQLAQASELFGRAGELFRASPPTRELAKRYQERCMLRRADCAFELGAYADAIGMYESAVKDSPQTNGPAAYVKISNAYALLGKMDEARQANARAQAMLDQLRVSGRAME